MDLYDFFNASLMDKLIEHQIIDKKGKPNKYGEPKIFESMGAAINWCDRHTYGGMSHYYKIKEVKK